MSKNELRKEAKRRILGIDREAESAMIIESLRALPEFHSASTILAFCPLADEPDITPLLSDERVLLPFIHAGRMAFSSSRRFHRSLMGFLEPEMSEADYEKALMLVPLLGYNSKLCRLGRGGGYYDRYIRENRDRIRTIGLAFSASFFPDFSEEEHDAALDAVLTPSGQMSASSAY